MHRERLHPSLRGQEFTLDGIIFPPHQVPEFEWSQVDTTSPLTRNITLKTPLVSSPMDTVTEHRMAILMALQGGIGVIHYNFPTIEKQMAEVEKVRRYEAGFVTSPQVIGPGSTVGDVRELAEKNGFYSYPITEDGTLDTPLVGIVTHRDVRFREDPLQPVIDLMTPRVDMIVARREDTLDQHNIRGANALIRQHNIDTLPIIDDENKVVALVTDSDLAKDERYPLATKDENKQLKVLVAVESRLQAAKERIACAAKAGANGIIVDARNIFRDHLDIAKFTKRQYPELDVILGNVVTPQVIKIVMDEVGEHVDAFRVGMGTGEVCTTTEALGIGRAMGTSIHEIEQVLKLYRKRYGHIGIIADGGIKSPHHIVGALMLGADAVMMGSELAGLEESPVQSQYNSDQGRMEKRVRGMGSIDVIRERAGSHRYMVANNIPFERFAEGIEKKIPYKGEGEPVIRHLFTGVRQAMHGLGHRTVDELHQNGYIFPWIPQESKGKT